MEPASTAICRGNSAAVDRLDRPRVSSGRRMTYEAIATFLRACPVFAAVPAREMAALAAVAREETYRARDYVFTEGDQADWFCLVRSGRVKILRASRSGKEVVL